MVGQDICSKVWELILTPYLGILQGSVLLVSITIWPVTAVWNAQWASTNQRVQCTWELPCAWTVQIMPPPRCPLAPLPRPTVPMVGSVIKIICCSLSNNVCIDQNVVPECFLLSSAGLELNMWDTWIHVLHGECFQWPTPYQCRENLKVENT